MNNAGQKFVVGGICRPDGAWSVCGVLATKMPLLAELGYGINDIGLFYENDVRLPTAIKGNEITLDELKTWPILEEIRSDSRYAKFSNPKLRKPSTKTK
jgi:hypothetical protein